MQARKVNMANGKVISLPDYSDTLSFTSLHKALSAVFKTELVQVCEMNAVTRRLC